MMNALPSKRTKAWLCLVSFLTLASIASAQPPHIIGIHDDSPTPTDWVTRAPGDTAWITATEAIGANPSDFSGKTYSPPAGSKIVARLNNGYGTSGTIPLPSEYANFATRAKNFVANSTGCNVWIIGNETNLSSEWPTDGNGDRVYVSPADYADCFQQCYNAIKSVRPNDKVLVQAIAPWAGPYNFPGEVQPDNWTDYLYMVLEAVTTGAGSVTPDGLALHINSRTYELSSLDFGQLIDAGDSTLEFSWGVYRDWIQFGIPRDLWDLPVYATESNGRLYWDGDAFPGESSVLPYQSGWLQAVYGDVDDWNANAANFGMPIYQCVNMYRWANLDDWSIDAASNRSTILADLESAASAAANRPQPGGNRLSFGTPDGTRIDSGITATADSYATGFEPEDAFDGSVTTRWASDDTGSASTHWLVADLGSIRTITGYVVRHASSSGQTYDTADKNTVGLLIEARNSTSDPWTLHSVVRTNTPGVDPPDGTELVYDIPVTARYVRLFVNDMATVTSGARGRVQEFEIYEGSAPGGALTSGGVVVGAVGAGDWHHYYIDTPSDAVELDVIMTGTNDADLYVRRGAQPTLTAWDFRPYDGNSNEEVVVNATTNPTLVPGDRYYISVNGFAAAGSSYELSATVVEPDPTPDPGFTGRVHRIEAENYQFIQGVGQYSDDSAGNAGGEIHPNEDVDIYTIPGGGYRVGLIRDGEYCAYSIDAAGGMYEVEVRHSGVGYGRIRIEVNGVSVGTLDLPSTGSYTTFTTAQGPVIYVPAGLQTFRWICEDYEFNLDYFDLISENDGPALAEADSFDYPGANPASWFVAGDVNDFYNSTYHPGEDWNWGPGPQDDWGKEVLAVANGVVEFTGYRTDAWGNIVYIEHQLPDSSYVWSQYAHLSEILVQPGDNVVKGQPIGRVGRGYNDGYSAHLHIEIRKIDRDPWAWVNGWTTTQVNTYYHNPSNIPLDHHPTVGFIESHSPTDDVVINGSFEGGFTSGVGNSWNSWTQTGSAAITFGQASLNKYDGSSSQYWARGDSQTFVGGVYQTVATQPGVTYELAAALKRQSSATGQTLAIGYDLNGGTNGSAASVSYVDVADQGDNAWHEASAVFTATGTATTIFAKGGHTGASGASAYYYVDAVSMVPTDEPPNPDPGPGPDPGGGPLYNGVDPENLGVGLWIWYMSNTYARHGFANGDIDGLFDHFEEHDIDWLTIKCGDGVVKWDGTGGTQQNFTAEMVTKAHARGIKVFAWTYVYGNDPLNEAEVAKWALSLGADGFIIDAEGEYKNKPTQATQLATAIKDAYPTHFLAYAPYAYIQYHLTYPWVEFGKVCDAVMPQVYWKTIGVTPDQAVRDMNYNYNYYQSKWIEQGDGDAVKPVIPVGQTYDNVSDAEVTAWFNLLNDDANPAAYNGYGGTSFWSAQHMTQGNLDAVRDGDLAPNYGLDADTTVVDDLGTSFTVVSGTWTQSTNVALWYKTSYLWADSGTGSARVRWAPTLAGGDYEVFVWYCQSSSRPTNAKYEVTHTGGTTTVTINQQTNGRKWVSLGAFTLDGNSKVELSNNCNGTYIVADAVAFAPTTIAPTPNVPPLGAFTSPTADDTVPYATTTYAFSGTASDSDGSVASVEYRVNGGAWQTATGTTSWSFTATGLQVGGNSVSVRALDDDSDYSSIISRTITRENFVPEITNPSFENGFTGGVANGWTSWSSSWSNPITFGQASINKHDGSYSQYWARTDSSRFNGGIYQVIDVVPGETYDISAWLKRQGNANDEWLEFGYDLSGGTDAEAGSVVYTTLQGLGLNVWVNYTATVTASGNHITLFAKGGTYNQSGNNNYFYVDEVTLAPTSE